LRLDPNIIIAVITSLSSLIAALFSIKQNNNILGYKVDELRKQVEKMASINERVAALERDVKTAFNKIDEQKEDIHKIEGRIIE